jgi:uncharacterized protein (TIGR02266 family)
MTAKNRRRHNRVRAQGVSVRVKSDSTSALLVVGNLSAGGVFVRAPKMLPVGTPVTLELTGPGIAMPVRLFGHVANALTHPSGRSEGMGIQFDNVPASNLDRLQELVARFSQSAGEGDSSRAAVRDQGATGDPFSSDREVARAERKDQRTAAERSATATDGPRSATPVASPRVTVTTPVPLAALPPLSPPVLSPVSPGPSLAELQAVVRAQQTEIAQLKNENALLREELKKRALLLAQHGTGSAHRG